MLVGLMLRLPPSAGIRKRGDQGSEGGVSLAPSSGLGLGAEQGKVVTCESLVTI